MLQEPSGTSPFIEPLMLVLVSAAIFGLADEFDIPLDMLLPKRVTPSSLSNSLIASIVFPTTKPFSSKINLGSPEAFAISPSCFFLRQSGVPGTGFL